ncbi:MAG: bifunctional phosphopantothenoylcysteine decarboxylase/phosphopantothenate--cysteine ligase CoaBC [Calditrichaeota bacterium]|nr:bifunctional phosphopantothenoylcysteine decarboxylase/phosphopantothenate--cysteine ligase CoaBC [Calditrichota bacterium]
MTEDEGLPLSGRKVLLAVTGGIAAYKSCYLTREIVRAGGQVQVLMSAAATQFVGPLTFATLSGRPVLDRMFPDPPPADPIHLVAGHFGDLLVIAPATADFLAKAAHGFADDLPSSALLAFTGPVLLAPAMNPAMWQSPAVIENVARLRDRGLHFIGPERGDMGGVHEEPGVGRMSEPEAILARCEELLADRTRWAGRRVVVTTGPTRESLDPVRFISNRSSGRMGDAIAREAVLRGAEVFLIRGRGAEGMAPPGVDVVPVESASEMADAVKIIFEDADLLIMAAAVADWRPRKVAETKLKKRDGAPALEWEETEDILSWAGRNRSRQAVVGFALETTGHLAEASAKLKAKGVDLIALNDPTRGDSRFGGDTIRLTLVGREGDPVELPVLDKRAAARRLLEAAGRYLPHL